MSLVERVYAAIREEGLIEPGDRVVVGVSGGPDSLCLLHVLLQLRGRIPCELHVAHLNHRLRGEQADEDARYVADIAAQWGLPCTVEECDVATLARTQRLAVEEAARRARYAFLARVAMRIGARRVAVAHHADDQSETVLMHWLRGSGLAGLRGMLPATPMAGLHLAVGHGVPPEIPPDLILIRPLLLVPRAMIEEYCRTHQLHPRFDRSNLDTTLFRNKLRHELLPYLEREFKPGFREILRRSAAVFRDEYNLLRQLLLEMWPQVVREERDRAILFDRVAWQALHPALQRSTLREAIRRLRRDLRDISFESVEQAVRLARTGSAGSRATLPRGLELRVEADVLIVGDAGEMFLGAEIPLLFAERLLLVVPGETFLPDTSWSVRVTRHKRDELPPDWDSNRDPWRAFLDARAARAPLSLRQHRPGDRFRPLGLGGHSQKVGNFWTNARVPSEIRPYLPLLVDAQDTILWVCGGRLDERARIREDTEEVLCVRFERAGAEPSGEARAQDGEHSKG